jgi:hypothetical protein
MKELFNEYDNLHLYAYVTFVNICERNILNALNWWAH